jgi:hypothetical protein
VFFALDFMLLFPLVFPREYTDTTLISSTEGLFLSHNIVPVLVLETEESLKEIHQGGKVAIKTEMDKTLEKVFRYERLPC